jgi:hypothetical protein
MIDEEALRMLAKSISLGVYDNAEEAAFKQLKHVFDMGRMEGKGETYRAERRTIEAEIARRAAKREERSSHG